ncbi:MAG: putative lipid II flippase FtsW [Clostridiales bacterium]|nr:putative lipid II flippase FtsW [Clostridiales bacterium]
MSDTVIRQRIAQIKNKNERRGDYLLLFLVIALSIVGLIFVYSASKYSAETTFNNSFYFAGKHLVGLLIGFCALIFGANFNYKRLQKTGVVALIVAIILLLTVFTPLGYENYGATRWIKLGGITVQPSEIAKICFVIFVASYFAKDPTRAKSFLKTLPVIGAGGIICVCIILEPNMSITVCFGLLMLALLFASGMKISHFILILTPIALCVPLLIIAEPYRLNRLSAFLNPWASPKGEGYQLLQSLYALGSGGWFGVGLFNSRQKFRFLPFSESDFILAVIGEEVGFIGLALLFALIFFIVVRGIKIALKSKDYFGFLLAIGISCIFGIQSVINALVVTGSIPPTGLPLPLVSAGNTSLIVFLFSFGILFNVSKGGKN